MKKLFKEFLCKLFWHDWELSSKDNFQTLIRTCKDCGAVEESKWGNSLAPTEYWIRAK